MFSSFNKGSMIALLALISLNTHSTIMASECCEEIACNRAYVGAFGGGLFSDSTHETQMGTAFFTEAAGGPLAVLAQGSSNKTSSGFGGVQLGYEWSQSCLNIGCTGWSIAPALEIEGYWYSRTTKAHLINPSDRLPEHDFYNTFHIDSGVYLANAVFTLNNSFFGEFTPYVGGGIGATRLSIKNASSIQVDPPEVGINHFNSKRSDSSWAFAAQVKTGLRYKICESLHIFGEYRYLFVDSSNYIFGSTVYPSHAATSPWNVKLKNTHYNAFAVGIQYDL